MGQRITRSEAAQSLGVNKSTITRWVQKHPALLDENGRVSLEELKRHRDTVVNPALQTRGVSGSGEPPMAPPAAQAPAASMNDHRARKEEVRAAEAELDLAERVKATLRRSDVEQAISEAAELLRQRAMRLVRDRAEHLARIDDVRAMEAALGEMMEEYLVAASDDLSAAVTDEAEFDAA